MPQLLGELSPKRLLPSLAAGLVIAIISITVATAFAELIFSEALPGFVPAGIGYMLFATVAIATVTGLTSSFPGVVAAPQDGPAAILALVSVAIVQGMPASATPQESFVTVVAALALACLLTGAIFLLLGFFKQGDLVRYIPYPVIGGFLAGTGLLLVQGAIPVMTGAPLGPSLTQPDLIAKLLPGLAFAVFLLVTLRRVEHFLLMPGMLLVTIVAFFLILWLTNTTIAEATTQGWLLGSLPAGGLWHPPSLSDLEQVNWSVLIEQAGSLAAVVLVSVISLLLYATGLEIATGQEMDLNRELKAAGAANLVAGLGGGMVGFHVLSESTLVYKMGARSRLGSIFLSAVCLIILLAGGSLLSLFPKFVLGGLLLFLGLDFLVTWVYDAWFTIPRVDYFLIILILVVIGTAGFLQGIGLGVILAVILFVIDYSRISPIKHQFSGANYHSTVERPRLYRQLLHRKGHWLYILKLQGFIFFGTANGLLEQVRQRIDDPNLQSPRYIVLDFRLVTGLDSSAALSFARMRQLAEEENIVLVFTHLSAVNHRQLEKMAFRDGDARVLPDLDRGIEWCEDQMISTFESVGLGARPQTLRQQLEDALPEADHVTSLLTYLDEKDAQPGDYLTHQGEAPNGLYFIETGRVTVQLELTDGSVVRLRTMDAGTVVGELGMYLNAPASASVVAEQPTTYLHLSVDALRQMETDDPALALAFHCFMAELMAERLVSTNDTIEALLN